MNTRILKGVLLSGVVALLCFLGASEKLSDYTPPPTDAIRPMPESAYGAAYVPEQSFAPSSSKISESSEMSTFKPVIGQYQDSLVSIVSGAVEAERSIANDLKVDQENIKLVSVNYENLFQVSGGDVVTVPTIRGDLVDFYISSVEEDDGNFVYIEGHLKGYDSGYLLGLTVDRGGAIDGVYLTDVGRYRVYTINGQEVLEKAETLPDEVYH